MEGKFKFGKYKGCVIKDCEDEQYLKWLIEKSVVNGKLKYYIQKKYNMPKNKYIVTVDEDKKYEVLAYNDNDAIWECNKKYNIQTSQSGVNYNVKKI